MNLVYGYLFKPTNQIKYIGKTNNLLYRRKQHEQYDIINSNRREYHYPLSRAIRKYGIDNFEVIILEQDIPDELIEEREIYWIDFYQTYYNGYNQTKGGLGGHHYEKFSEEQIDSIIEMIKNKIPFSEISEVFNISISHLSGINKGTKHHRDNEIYPLNSMTHGRKLEGNDIEKIKDLLINTNLTQTEIAQQYNVCSTVISRINLGKTYKDSNLNYPLRDAYKIPRTHKKKGNIV